MKRVLALMAGSLLLAMTDPVSAQSGSPPHQGLRDGLQAFFSRSPGNQSPKIADDSLIGGTPPLARRKMPPVDEKVLRNYCQRLVMARRRVYYLSDHLFKMCLQVRGIYTWGEMIFFQVEICNRSNLDYDVDSIRLYIADKQIPKKGHLQAIALPPLYVYGNVRVIRGKSREMCVIALPKFTLPANKRLVMQVLEKYGGRHLQLQADNSALVRARLI
jgi:uncharacterized protein DUF4138